jgi:molybdopterin converting factor small subunit
MAAAKATRDDLIKIKVGSILNLKEVMGQRELDLFMPRGSTMEELIASIIDTFGERLSSLIHGSGSQTGQGVFPHVRMMVNGQDIGFLSGMATVLQEGDEVLILPMVAGG